MSHYDEFGTPFTCPVAALEECKYLAISTKQPHSVLSLPGSRNMYVVETPADGPMSTAIATYNPESLAE